MPPRARPTSSSPRRPASSAAPWPPWPPTPRWRAGTASRCRAVSWPRSTASPTSTAPGPTPGATSPRSGSAACRPTTPATARRLRAVVAGERGRDAVLDAVGAADARAVHEHREGDRVAAGGLVDAGQGADADERAGLGPAVVLGRGAAHPPADRARAAGHRQRALEGAGHLLVVHALEQAHDLARGGAIGARQARAVDDLRVHAEALKLGAHDGDPRARG